MVPSIAWGTVLGTSPHAQMWARTRLEESLGKNPGKNKFLVVVKVARPKQDDRYDLPIIGKGTIKSMIEARANVLAVEAGKTIILDIDEVCALADKNNISIVAR